MSRKQSGKQQGERQEDTGEYAVLVVPRSFSFEALPDVAERVIERTRKYLEELANQKEESGRTVEGR